MVKVVQNSQSGDIKPTSEEFIEFTNKVSLQFNSRSIQAF